MSASPDGRELSLDERRALLTQVLREHGARARETLSAVQRRFWLLRQLEASAPTHVSAGWELRGPLDWTLLQRALQLVLERHEVLRTGFVDVEGAPVPVVAETGFVPLAFRAVTRTRSRCPTSAEDSAYRVVVAPEIAGQFEPSERPPSAPQRTHW